jgi:RNA polymerase sigma factor (sigma-70 family)
MWQRNNGQGEANILQNQFTAFLVNAVRWKKIDYLRKRTKQGTREIPTDFDDAFTQTLEAKAENAVSLEQPVLESIALARALSRISDRERYVFFARTLEGRSFDELASELGMGYKGVAAIYYRAIRKLKKEL